MKFESERLLLRPFRPSDLLDLHRYTFRPSFYRYLPLAVPTPESVRAFLDAQIEAQTQSNRRRYSFAVEPKGLGHLVGAAHVEITSTEHHSGELGYGLDAEFEGRGIMTEAVARLLRFGFDDLRLRRIWAVADVDNAKSCRLLERVGMRREGRLRHEKLIRGEWRDSFLYARLFVDRDE